MGQMPNPKPEDFDNKRDYLIALTRRPNAKPRVSVTETPLDVSREDPPVTIFYVFERTRGAVRIMGVYRGAEELAPTAREIGFIKQHVRQMEAYRNGDD